MRQQDFLKLMSKRQQAASWNDTKSLNTVYTKYDVNVLFNTKGRIRTCPLWLRGCFPWGCVLLFLLTLCPQAPRSDKDRVIWAWCLGVIRAARSASTRPETWPEKCCSISICNSTSILHHGIKERGMHSFTTTDLSDCETHNQWVNQLKWRTNFLFFRRDQLERQHPPTKHF